MKIKTKRDSNMNEFKDRVADAADAAENKIDRAKETTVVAVEDGARKTKRWTERTADKLAKAANVVGERAHEVTERAHDVADRATDRVEASATSAGNSLQNGFETTTRKVERRTDNITDYAGEKAAQLAEKIRTGARKIDPEDWAETGAEQVDRSADYLRSTPPDAILRDAATTARKHPVKAVIAGIGIGVVLSKLLRPKA